MSHQEPTHPTKADEVKGDTAAPAGRNSPDVTEEYLKYRQAEREEEQRLERYERTRSTDTTREKDDAE